MTLLHAHLSSSLHVRVCVCVCVCVFVCGCTSMVSGQSPSYMNGLRKIPGQNFDLIFLVYVYLCMYPPIQDMQYMSVKICQNGDQSVRTLDENFTGRRVTQEKSRCGALKSRAPHISDFTPVFSAPEQGAIIGIAGSTDSSCASTQGNRMQRGRGKREKVSGRWRETDTETGKESGWVEVESVGEREIDKPCIISPSLALEATWLHLNDIFGNGK